MRAKTLDSNGTYAVIFETGEDSVERVDALRRAAQPRRLEPARVRPTLEVIVNASPAHLKRVYDPESGLALIKP